jgi:hypothetical protein
MTVTGKNQKFAMCQKMIDDLRLDQSKTTGIVKLAAGWVV